MRCVLVDIICISDCVIAKISNQHRWRFKYSLLINHLHVTYTSDYINHTQKLRIDERAHVHRHTRTHIRIYMHTHTYAYAHTHSPIVLSVGRPCINIVEIFMVGGETKLVNYIDDH
jgi:hypothetical protein